MIRKRKWLSDDPQASYLIATKGLSIFTVGHIAEDLVAEMNEQKELLKEETQVTAKELSVAKKMKAVVPDNNSEFVEMINTFSNLLFVLFSSACPHYLQVNKILAALNSCKIPALRGLARSMRASILLILLLQTCHFAAGNITEIAEIKTMMNKSTSKDGHISHAEVLAQLLYDTKKRPPPSSQDIYLSAQIPRLTHEPEPSPAANRVHPLLRKEIVDNIPRVSDGVSLTSISKYSNTTVKALCLDTKRYALGMMGMCKSRNCARSHTMATYQEATHIVNLLENQPKTRMRLNLQASKVF